MRRVTRNVRRLVGSALVTVLLVCTTGVARANGRFPLAQAILTVPGTDGKTVFLRATFGVLLSHDAGKTWRWICERSLGYTGQWDPPVAVTSDGRLWVGREKGLVTTADGCGVEAVPELADETVKDLTTDPKGEVLYAITSAPDRRSALWRRTKAGKWDRLGQFEEGYNVLTVEIAPSRPSRIYVSGEPYTTIRGRLIHSDDNGKTWIGGANDLEAEGPFFIGDVDPKNADRVILRHLHRTGSDVLVTENAGKTFTNVLTMKSAMFGFAKSLDGATYWAGSGLPEHGVYESKDRGAHFDRVANQGSACLFAAPGGVLYQCTNPVGQPTLILSQSTDEGHTFTPLAKFTEIEGPVACASDGGTTSDAGPSVCAEDWPAARELFTPRPPDAGAPAPTSSGRRNVPEPAAPSAKSSCGCSIIGTPTGCPDHGWLTTGLLPLVLWWRARGRSGSRRAQTGPSVTTGHRSASVRSGNIS